MKVNFERFKKEKDRRDKVMQGDRFMNIANFYHQKGLLKFAQTPRVIRGQKIAVTDILWAAKYEPRVLKVFPAAFIHFKAKFTGIDKIPKALMQIIDLIVTGSSTGPDYKGIKFSDMKRWANIELKDKRSRPVRSQKKLMSFKFNNDLIEKVKKLASEKGLNNTELLESLILEA